MLTKEASAQIGPRADPSQAQRLSRAKRGNDKKVSEYTIKPLLWRRRGRGWGGLLLPHDRQYLRQKDRHDRDEYEEDNLACSREKYRRKAKYRREWEYDRPYLSCTESEIHQAKVEVCGLVSLEGILSLEYPARHHIDEIDEIDTKDCYCGGDLASCDDREGREKKCEHDRPRVTHDDTTRDICSCEPKCGRDDDREKREEKGRVFLSCDRSISEIEFQCESTHDDEWYECESSCESRDSIRKIHTIEHQDIPEYRHDEWDIVDTIELSGKHEVKVICSQIDDTTEYIAHIWDLDTRESDEDTDSYLHDEAKYWWHSERTPPDSVHIIDEWYGPDDKRDDEYDMQTMLEDGGELEYSIEYWDKYQECEDHRDSGTIWNWVTSCLWLIKMRSIQESISSEAKIHTPEYKRWEDARSDKDDKNFESEGHEWVGDSG